MQDHRRSRDQRGAGDRARGDPGARGRRRSRRVARRVRRAGRRLRAGGRARRRQKAVSKVEGRVVDLAEVEPSERARELAGDGDPRRVEVILREAREVVRSRPPLVITETLHGFVCASAGVDASNAKGPDTVVLLRSTRMRRRRVCGIAIARAHGRLRRSHRQRLLRTRVATGHDGRRARRRGRRARCATSAGERDERGLRAAYDPDRGRG